MEQAGRPGRGRLRSLQQAPPSQCPQLFGGWEFLCGQPRRLHRDVSLFLSKLHASRVFALSACGASRVLWVSSRGRRAPSPGSGSIRKGGITVGFGEAF